ncbi:MAG: Pycsar system effector family protein, partial [Candidatus Zixiibacteriota bacterium]
MNQQFAKDIFSNIQDTIRLADTKAGLILAVNGVLLGFTGNQLLAVSKMLYEYPCSVQVMDFVLLFLLLTFLLLSAIFSLLVIFPRFTKSESLMYFGHINSQYGGNPDGFYVQLSQAQEERIIREYAEQIVVISVICTRKHHWARGSLAWLT